jgi:hypothetical protein
MQKQILRCAQDDKGALGMTARALGMTKPTTPALRATPPLRGGEGKPDKLLAHRVGDGRVRFALLAGTVCCHFDITL